MITIGYCNSQHDENYMEYLREYFNNEVEIIEKICNKENKRFISEAYNEIIDESQNEILILLHNNVKFIRSNEYPMRVDKSIESLFKENKEYGIIGVASSCKTDKSIIDRDYSCNCSLYSESNADGSNLKVFVSENGTIEPFSLELCEDVSIDGCFIALDRSRIKARFCNDNKSFHFYDIEFCIGNFLKGVKIGKTKAFLIQHYSSQADANAWNEWKKIRDDYFIPKWKNKLPIRHYKHEVPLLLITALINVENVPQIAESIYNNLISKGTPNLIWLISIDSKIKNENLEEIEKNCKKYHINYIAEIHGNSTEKNYGGTMFNDMLYMMHSDYYRGSLDPWVYILDDDNTICPLMGAQLKSMTDTASQRSKKAIWMSMHREDGFIDTIRSYSIYGKGAKNQWTYADEFMPDPSQLLMRLSLIDEMGYFDEGFAYDQKLWYYFYNNIDKICLPEEWHEGHWSIRGNNNFYQCYHNGINNEKNINSVEQAIKNKEPISFSLIAGLNESCERFIMKKQDGIKMINNLKQKYKYSILTCIFNKYETLKPIKDFREDVEYVCVTDDKDLTSEQWKIIYCDDVLKRMPKTNQFTYIRFHPFQFVSTDTCITIDASMEILKDFWDDLIVPFIEGGFKYGVKLHSSRSDIYEEVNAWKNIRGYKDGCYEKVINFLKSENYDIQGMVEAGFIVHTNTKECNAINNMTWELCHELTVDTEIDRNFQIDLAYILNKYYDEKTVMLIHPYILEGSHIKHWTHNGNYYVVYNSIKTCPCLFWNRKVKPFMVY